MNVEQTRTRSADALPAHTPVAHTSLAEAPLSHAQVVVAALRSFDAMTDARLRGLLAAGEPAEVWERIRRGDPTLARSLEGCRDVRAALTTFQRESERVSLAVVRRHLETTGTRVWWRGERSSDAFHSVSQAFEDAMDPPETLFLRGSLAALDCPRAAIVGTRTATAAGREMARLLGRELAQAGVCVVSGLARGIDAAAHAGALQPDYAVQPGPPIAVVGTGVDHPYPSQNRALWEQVAARGLLISEQPLGRGPTASAFPLRNRLIAQLGLALVVVESGESGGSMITVDRALERGRPVLAVPGTPLNESAAGSNALLRGGGSRVALPCLSTADVLAVLEYTVLSARTEHADCRPSPTAAQAEVLGVLGWESRSLGQIAGRSTLPIGEIALQLSLLEDTGWVQRTEGRWHRCA